MSNLLFRFAQQSSIVKLGLKLKLKSQLHGNVFIILTFSLTLVVGLEKAEVGHANEFEIYTHEAGAGGLTISIEGPSKAAIHFDERAEGMSVASFKAEQPGKLRPAAQ